MLTKRREKCQELSRPICRPLSPLQLRSLPLDAEFRAAAHRLGKWLFTCRTWAISWSGEAKYPCPPLRLGGGLPSGLRFAGTQRPQEVLTGRHGIISADDRRDQGNAVGAGIEHLVEVRRFDPPNGENG